MSGAFTTRTDEMVHAATKVDDVDNEVRAVLSSLQSQVESVQSSWQGQAATTFQSLMMRFKDDTTRLSQALTAISEQIRCAGQGYASQDQAAHDVVSSAGRSLNLS